MKHLLSAAVIGVAAMLAAPAVSAAAITFSNTPNDTVGSVFTTDDNDGWNTGRGMRFDMTANTVIESFGVLQDLTGIDMNFEIFDVTNNAVLRSGSTGAVTTTGLEFVDVSFAALTLVAGNTYHMEFDFTGDSNQNFFHDEGGSPAYTEGAFTNINGTSGGINSTSNTVIALFRVNGVDAAVPLPAALPLMVAGLGAFGLLGWRRKRATA